jgi:hypothetical protein
VLKPGHGQEVLALRKATCYADLERLKWVKEND